MKCQRCFSLRSEEATYRAYIDATEMAVCTTCADEAWELRIAVEAVALDSEERKGEPGQKRV